MSGITMKPRILVVGSVNMDLAARVARAPEAGETVIGTQYAFAPGGKGANAAVAAARLGTEVSFCGCIGNDDYGRSLRAELRAEGIDDGALAVDDGAPTGMALIFVEDSGQNRIAVYPGANMSIGLAQVKAALERQFDAVMLQLEISREVIFETARLAAEKGVPVVLDAGPAQEFPLERMASLAILSPNETETRALCGIDPVDDAACAKACAALRSRSRCSWVVLKLGERGCYIDDGRGVSARVPAFSITPVDTTAAGDTFTGALTLEYLRTGDMPSAARFANAAGALCATRPGAMPSLPTAQDVRTFMG